jgi:5-methylthioadenosine/S-adenosylhomocysteine deaminase
MTEPKDIDLLVQADVLYPMMSNEEIILNAEVAIINDQIVYAGPKLNSNKWNAKEIILGDGKVVMPGFVNCHSHAASLVFRGQSDDGAGGKALYSVAFRAEATITPEQWRDFARVGVLDMVKAGFTTINDIWYEPEALAEICLEAGLRAQIAYKVFDVCLEDLYLNLYNHSTKIGDMRLNRGVDFVKNWNGAGNGLITGRIGPHATDTCSSELHKNAYMEAKKLKVGRHTHAAQSAGEVAYIRSKYGVGPVVYLQELGVLDPDIVLAHLTYADNADLKAAASGGVKYAHCSTIYPRRGVYPDIIEITKKGIEWGLATDWMMNDPFEAMRNALNAIRLIQGKHTAYTSTQALYGSTTDSATVLGLENSIGKVQEGFKADLIQIDINQPHLVPFYAEYASIAYYARASDVVTSIINGKVVMRDRVVIGIDETKALEAVAKHIPALSDKMLKLGGAVHPGLCPCGF